MTRITLRPCTDDDLPFLQQVYSDTREEELRLVDWTDQQKRQFVQFQFDAQHRYYREKFPGASYQVILLDGEPAGRLYVDRRPHEIQIIDIALRNRHRGQGVGGRLMADLLAEGAATGRPVRIHVEQANPALRWYERMGFREIGEVGVYLHMEWLPDATCPPGATRDGPATNGTATNGTATNGTGTNATGANRHVPGANGDADLAAGRDEGDGA